MPDLEAKKVLITGGLGMIGSTIARMLVEAGAAVTILDACIEPFGANLFNVDDVKGKISVNFSDIRDKESLKILVQDKDIVFNLAGQVSHNDSITNPYLDADINYIGHLNVLEAVRRYSPEAVVVYSGSRLQFGTVQYTPVDEGHPLNPRTPYALNKTAAENLYRYYHELYGTRCVIFRIANPYGPRAQMKHSKYTIINWFIRQAMADETLTVFGDGEQIRDYIYVDDLAKAFILAAVTPGCHGETFNIGSGVATRFKEMVQAVVGAVGTGIVKTVDWPQNYVNVETGDYVSDISKLRAAIPWVPETDLETGIARTYAYYRQFARHYY